MEITNLQRALEGFNSSSECAWMHYVEILISDDCKSDYSDTSSLNGALLAKEMFQLDCEQSKGQPDVYMFIQL